ncbi:MAG: ATP-binding protein [Steroidobacteraceae bacterium]
MGSEAQPLDPSPGGGFLQDPPEGFSSADFHLLAGALPHMVWICRPDGTLDYMNGQGLEYFGSSLREATRLFPSGPVAHPEDHERSLNAWQQAIRAETPLSLEVRLRCCDGEFRWHLIRTQPVRDPNGQVLKWLGTATNVHDVKERNELSAFLLELSTDFARMDNPHELVCTAMFRLRERLGAAQVTLAEIDALRGEAIVLRQGGEDGSNLQVVNLPLEPFAQLAAEAKQGLMTVVRDTRKDTRSAPLYDRWYGLENVGAVVAAPLLHGGSLVALLTVVETEPRNWRAPEVELTKRVAEIVWPALEKARADRALAVSEQRLRLAQAVSQIGTWELDPATRSIVFSPESYELFGLNRETADLYPIWMSLIDPRDRYSLSEMVQECSAAGSAEAEYRYRHPQRGVRWIYCRAGRVDDASHSCIVGVSLDVTGRRQAEEALKDVNQRKDEFLAMLGHELRNPLAPIRNAAQVLRAHSTGQPDIEWARTVIERQTRHLVRLVDDLLDVSRMVRGQIALQKAPVEIAELVQHAVETSRPLIRARRHQLQVSLPAEPVRIDGDLIRLVQALSNLLNNAAKYTDEGGEIRVDGRLEGRQVVLRVRDTGPGIAPALLPHVFDLFTQAERTLDRAQGGLGIGLTLVKLLIGMHGGTVEARNSDRGRGAEFIVRLPAADADSAGTGTAAPGTAAVGAPDSMSQPGRAMRVLVVDDNVDAADSIALLLSIDGFEARSVHSASAALDTVGSFKPEVVLLDIGLPIMDGYEVARRLRARVPPGQMRIVALSGYGQPADRERAAQAGFDEYLVKPVEPTALSGFLRALQ